MSIEKEVLQIVSIIQQMRKVTDNIVAWYRVTSLNVDALMEIQTSWE